MPRLLSGRIQISPEIDYLERAFDASKYGEFSQHPYLEATIPTLWDTVARARGQACDVHLHAVCAVQAARCGLGFATRCAGRHGGQDAWRSTRPTCPGWSKAREVITPKDLEQTYGLTGGHIFHGELALDQLFTMRPLLDWAQYRTPIQNLYLCGSGTHPGIGLNGVSGANAAREI